MDNDLVAVVIVGLAAYRLARLLCLDDGPGDILRRLRGLWIHNENGLEMAEGVIGKFLMCPQWCVSLWAAAIMFALWWLWSPVHYVWLVLAAAQVAALVGCKSEQ